MAASIAKPLPILPKIFPSTCRAFGSIAETIAPRLAPGLIHALNDERISQVLSPGARAIARRRAMIVPDIGEDESPEFRHIASTYNLASAWAYPIPNRKGKPAGALLLYFRSPGAPSATDAVIAEAKTAGLSFTQRIAMPANNIMLLFRAV